MNAACPVMKLADIQAFSVKEYVTIDGKKKIKNMYSDLIFLDDGTRDSAIASFSLRLRFSESPGLSRSVLPWFLGCCLSLACILAGLLLWPSMGGSGEVTHVHSELEFSLGTLLQLTELLFQFIEVGPP